MVILETFTLSSRQREVSPCRGSTLSAAVIKCYTQGTEHLLCSPLGAFGDPMGAGTVRLTSVSEAPGRV